MIVEGGSVLVVNKKEEEKVPPKVELTNCPRCGRKMSWFEHDDGTVTPWCYWEQAPSLDPKLKI